MTILDGGGPERMLQSTAAADWYCYKATGRSLTPIILHTGSIFEESIGQPVGVACETAWVTSPNHTKKPEVIDGQLRNNPYHLRSELGPPCRFGTLANSPSLFCKKAPHVHHAARRPFFQATLRCSNLGLQGRLRKRKFSFAPLLWTWFPP